jgi:hypothetical protein
MFYETSPIKLEYRPYWGGKPATTAYAIPASAKRNFSLFIVI